MSGFPELVGLHSRVIEALAGTTVPLSDVLLGERLAIRDDGIGIVFSGIVEGVSARNDIVVVVLDGGGVRAFSESVCSFYRVAGGGGDV